MIPTLTQRSVETSPVTASASFGISQNDVAHILTMLRELVNFPRVSHDDQADATSQYLNWIRLNTAHTAPQASAPADVSRAVSPLGGIHSGRGGGGNFLTRW